MRPGALVVGLVLALAGCGERATSPGVDGGADGPGQVDAPPPQDGWHGDHFQLDAHGDGNHADAPLPVDAGPDALEVPDGGAPTTACAAAGGLLCTPVRWEICPAGTEPVAGADPHLGCGQSGWCCQAAPASTCSQSGQANCLPGACTGCWAAVAGLTCEAGRVCCQDVCD